MPDRNAERKIEELDDSSGSLGRFVDELYCGWVKARQAEDVDPAETAARLLEWMDEDEYGLCYPLERDPVMVFDKANLAAFVNKIRARFDAAANTTPKSDGSFQDRPDYVRRHFGETLRSSYAAQKDVAAYVALAEDVGRYTSTPGIVMLTGRRSTAPPRARKTRSNSMT